MHRYRKREVGAYDLLVVVFFFGLRFLLLAMERAAAGLEFFGETYQLKEKLVHARKREREREVAAVRWVSLLLFKILLDSRKTTGVEVVVDWAAIRTAPLLRLSADGDQRKAGVASGVPLSSVRCSTGFSRGRKYFFKRWMTKSDTRTRGEWVLTRLLSLEEGVARLLLITPSLSEGMSLVQTTIRGQHKYTFSCVAAMYQRSERFILLFCISSDFFFLFLLSFFELLTFFSLVTLRYFYSFHGFWIATLWRQLYSFFGVLYASSIE